MHINLQFVTFAGDSICFQKSTVCPKVGETVSFKSKDGGRKNYYIVTQIREHEFSVEGHYIRVALKLRPPEAGTPS